MSRSVASHGLPAALVAIVLTGCAGEPVVSASYIAPSYAPTQYSAAGFLPVVVRGNPYAVPKPDFDLAVADAMQGSTFGVVTRFAPAETLPPSAYRVVMVFNPGATTNGGFLCTRSELPDAMFGTAPGARVAVSAALCQGDQYLTYADGSIGTLGGPQGEDFRRGVQRMSRSLFPPQDHDRPSEGKKTTS